MREVLPVIACILTLLIASMAWLVVTETNKWETFKSACEVVGGGKAISTRHQGNICFAPGALLEVRQLAVPPNGNCWYDKTTDKKVCEVKEIK